MMRLFSKQLGSLAVFCSLALVCISAGAQTGPPPGTNPNNPRPYGPTPTPGPGPGPANQPPAEPVLPCPFPPLDAANAQFIDRLLQQWEQHSAGIKLYRCDFERWEYDPVFGSADPREARTYAKGKIQYAAPDKGLFKIESIKQNTPSTTPGKPAEWIDKTDTLMEHWVCDGLKIFEFSYQKKQLIERVLPAELQGKAIVDGPLPFLFGAKAEKIKARYWLRLVTPADAQGEFWLEAVPKYRQDASNFKMVQVILDQNEFLPKALQLFDPGFDPQKNPKRTVFTFNRREVNFNQGLQIFLGQFYQPKTPLGWKFVSEPYVPEAGEANSRQTAANGGNARTEERPGASALKLLPFQRK